MKQILSLVLAAWLVIGCGPSQSAIQTAIAETQSAAAAGAGRCAVWDA